MVNFKSIQKIHRKIMYHDKCDVFIFDKVKKSNGATSTKKAPTPIYQNVPCKISFSLRTWDVFSKKEIDVSPHEKQPKIFTEVEYKIEPGYYIKAYRYDPQTHELIGLYEGQAGVPQVSLTHQEILLNVEGNN